MACSSLANTDGIDTELSEEIAATIPELRKYLAEQAGALSAMPNFNDYLPGIINDDDSPPLRAETVHERIRAISMHRT